MKKVILNQINKAVAGGSNYFYLPLHLVEDKVEGDHYETTADISKLFELDSNKVPVVKEVVVYREDAGDYVNLLYTGNKGKNYSYDSKLDVKLEIEIGNSVTFDNTPVVVESNTDETDEDGSPKDGGK